MFYIPPFISILLLNNLINRTGIIKVSHCESSDEILTYGLLQTVRSSSGRHYCNYAAVDPR